MARLLKLILKSPGAVVLHARHHSHWQSVSKMPWQGADMGLKYFRLCYSSRTSCPITSLILAMSFA